jgi:hypothetical protein
MTDPVSIPETRPIQPKEGLTCLAEVDGELQPVLLLERRHAPLSATYYWEVTTVVGKYRRAPVSEGGDRFRELTADWLAASLAAVDADLADLGARRAGLARLAAAPAWEPEGPTGG